MLRDTHTLYLATFTLSLLLCNPIGAEDGNETSQQEDPVTCDGASFGNKTKAFGRGFAEGFVPGATMAAAGLALQNGWLCFVGGVGISAAQFLYYVSAGRKNYEKEQLHQENNSFSGQALIYSP